MKLRVGFIFVTSVFNAIVVAAIWPTVKPRPVFLEGTKEVNGTLQYERQTQVTAPVSGVVNRILIQVGERVKLNQPLLILKRDEPGYISDEIYIRAPYDSLIRQINAFEGSRVTPQSPLLTVAAFDRMLFYAELFLEDFQTIRRGMEVWLKLPYLKEEVSAKIVNVFEGNLSKRTVQVVARVINSSGQLIPLSEGKMKFSTGRKRVLLVPAEALQVDQKGYFVWIKIEQKARKRYVQPGEINGVDFQILSGLDGTEDVLYYAVEDLQEGQIVD